jgi:hypothetical protein
MKLFRINNISRIVDKLCTLKAKEKYAYSKGMLKCVKKQLYEKRKP